MGVTLDDVTVCVPLHRSGPFVDVVAGNLRRIAPACRVIVSDPSGEDRTLELLERDVGRHPSIEWVGTRVLSRGWIAHYNDLRGRVRTPYFMWLPHDDEIGCEYLERCRDALVSEPGAAGATGDIDCILGPGLWQVELGDFPDRDERPVYRSEANRLLLEWNLGIAFRSVFRTAAVGPIRPTTGRSEWADIVWTYGVCLDHPIVHVPSARYRKRFYAGSAHAAWRRDLHPHALPHLVREVLDRPALADRDHVLAELVAGSARRSGEVVAEVHARHERARSEEREAAAAHAHRLATHVIDLEAALDEARGELADKSAEVSRQEQDVRRLEGELSEVRRSRTWRVGRALTAPVRAAGRIKSSRGRPPG